VRATRRYDKSLSYAQRGGRLCCSACTLDRQYEVISAPLTAERSHGREGTAERGVSQDLIACMSPCREGILCCSGRAQARWAQSRITCSGRERSTLTPSRTGGTRRSDTIKTHHNRVPIIERMIEQGKVVEPLAEFVNKVEVASWARS